MVTISSAHTVGPTLFVEITLNHCRYNVSIAPGLTKDYKIVIDLKVNNIFTLKTTCVACGANCTLDIPVVNEKVTFALPPCPLKGAMG